jgi:hypothetical protein
MTFVIHVNSAANVPFPQGVKEVFNSLPDEFMMDWNQVMNELETLIEIADDGDLPLITVVCLNRLCVCGNVCGKHDDYDCFCNDTD